MFESLRTKLAEDVEYVLESLTQGYHSEAKFELFKAIEKLEAQIQPGDSLSEEVLCDLKRSSGLLGDLLVHPNGSEGNKALQLLWKTQKRLRSV